LVAGKTLGQESVPVAGRCDLKRTTAPVEGGTMRRLPEGAIEKVCMPQERTHSLFFPQLLYGLRRSDRNPNRPHFVRRGGNRSRGALSALGPSWQLTGRQNTAGRPEVRYTRGRT
jgi:hypothetical protein